MSAPARSLAEYVGCTLVVGFEGDSVPATVAREMESRRRGGVILFRRNGHAPSHVHALCKQLHALLHGDGSAPLVCVDQEGGRVERVRPPLVALPPALSMANLDDAEIERVAHAQSTSLLAVGFTMNFAPVLDVHSREENPVIGDRAFGRTPERAAQKALAFARGMRAAGILSCGKHWPGHGDTTVDSHVALPTVSRTRTELDAQELSPFRAACPDGVDSLMTAHVVFPALDDARAATTSPRISTQLLRDELGFRGVLFSDDLEMRALTAPVGESAVSAMLAGCDALLVCRQESAAQDAFEALLREAERSPAFRARIEEAATRVTQMRARAVRGAGEIATSDTALTALLATEHERVRDTLARVMPAAIAVDPTEKAS